MVERKYDIPPGAKSGKCRGPSCGATIFFVPKPNDPAKRMPVNGDGTPHWVNCPDADRFRRRK